jgi:FecR protein
MGLIMSINRSHRLKGFIVLLLAIALLEGCASLAYLPGQQTVGKLRIIGDNVQVNQKKAIDGQTITSGDHVTTGADSSAYIYYLSGGFVQLDENTDPGWDLVFHFTDCVIRVYDFKHGQLFQKTSPKDCPSFIKTDHAELKRDHTELNVLATPQQTVITVLEGTTELVSPKQMNQLQGQQMVVTEAGIQSVRQLSEQELRVVTRWRDRFPPPNNGGAQGCGTCND